MQRFSYLAQFVLLAVLSHSVAGQDLDTFQVPDLSPPSVPDLDGVQEPVGQDDPFVDDEAIPAPAGYPNSALGLLDAVPMPFAHPYTHLWAGYCDGCETLVLPCACPAAWASVDALWLQRQGPDNYLLATDGQAAHLWNDQFNFDYELGVRVSYGEVVCDTPIEITYMGTHDWNSSIAVDGMGLNVPAAPMGGVFDDSDRVEANYASELHSIELNRLRFQSDCLTIVTGIRYIDAEEDFFLRADDGGSEGTIAITGDNRLLGIQAGADYTRGCNGWCYSAWGRAGIYANFAERDISITDEDEPLNDVTGESNDTEFAFAGQLGVGLTRHLGCGIKLRAGYELLWINGLALAAEQPGTAGGGFMLPRIDTDGDILYDGGYVGLEWNR